MTTIDEKRAYLAGLYHNDHWKDTLKHMSANQVVAVYLRFQRDGPPHTAPNKLNTSPLSLEEESDRNRQDNPDNLRLF